MTAFDRAWSVAKMAVHTCPVCGSGEIRRLNPDDVDLYCDNCEASWGINFIEGKFVRVQTGPVADREGKEQEKIQAHREKWDSEYAKEREAQREAQKRWEARRAEREAEE